MNPKILLLPALIRAMPIFLTQTAFKVKLFTIKLPEFI